jgi:carbon monoxide dehydrogenase subunit G
METGNPEGLMKMIAKTLLGATSVAATAGVAQAESVMVEIRVAAPADLAWAAVREPYEVDRRLVPGLVSEVRREGDTRIVTFANGFVVRERIVTIDDDAKRLVYSAIGGKATHHMASMQIFPDGDGARLVWISDFLPGELRPFIAANMDQGAQVIRTTLEAAAKAGPQAPEKDSGT